jgi:hypothetical protein
MKLLLLGTLGLALFTGASGTTGPLKDGVGNVFTWPSELARSRAEIADLRNGRGAAAPRIAADFAKAICSHDAAYVMAHTDPTLGMTMDQVGTQFDTMHTRGLDCTGVRYLGSVNATEFVFALRQGPKEMWYVIGLSDDGSLVVSLN